MKMYGGVEVQLHALLTSALHGREQTASRPDRFIPRVRGPRYPLDRRLGQSQSRSERGGEEKKSRQKLKPSRPSHILVTILTEVPWLPVYNAHTNSKSIKIGCVL